MTSTIKADVISALSNNADLTIQGAGTGVPNIAAGFKVAGAAGVPITDIRGGGTTGQVLTSTGASTAPTFQVAAGGSTTLIQTVELADTNTTNMHFTGFDASLYDHYLFSLQNVQPNGSGPSSEQRFRFISSSDGGSSYDQGSTNYGKQKSYHPSGSTMGFQQDNNESYCEWFGGFVTTPYGSNSGFSGYVRIWGAHDAATWTTFEFSLNCMSSTTTRYIGDGSYYRRELAVVDAVRFYWFGQNFAAGGSIRMYGFKKS